MMFRRLVLALGATALLAIASGDALAASGEKPRDIRYATTPDVKAGLTIEEAKKSSEGCMSCHEVTDAPSMHINPGVIIGCADCHGGDATVFRPTGTNKGEERYFAAQEKAHVLPRYPESWRYPSSANPPRTYTLLNREAPEYIRFVNPSDYRVAREACGACHLPIIQAAERSLMATGAMLWGGAAYNNGILPYKRYIIGSAYTRDGQPAAIKSPGTIEPWMTAKRGVLPQLVPLPAWEVIPPGDIFRVFERGGRNIVTQFPEIGLPSPIGAIQRLEEPGRPDIRQSMRGSGTGLRIAVPVINIHKTRLNDPFTGMMGTNDQPGDFRHSGCAACHVVYANERDPRHSGPYFKFGATGTTQTLDPTISRNEIGHPLKHEFTRSIPTSQCMNCHMHQPNIFLNSMLGYTMWDYEPESDKMFPKEQKYPTNEEMHRALDRNPEEAVIRGKWADVNFTKNVSAMNPDLEHTQFADYHGHGWNFRAIFKRDRKGNLLDAKGNKVANDDPDKFKKAVHMSSVHVDVGMHCIDCHFAQDNHGNGYIYGEVAPAIEIRCKDCHGTADEHPTLRTSGPAAPPSGHNLELIRVQDGRRRFEWRGTECDKPRAEVRDCHLVQRSALWPDLEWEVSLVKDTVDPDSPTYNPKAARAKLMSKGTDQKWGPGVKIDDRAHKDAEMECFTCHLSWTTSCGGCHLPIQANWKTTRHHYEGGETRNFATYNPQVARDEIFMLGKHQSIKGGTTAPIRSTSALILSSTNINRERIYIQQQPIASSGYSSQAFAPHYPHTERKTETKTCSDCHLSDKGDNNAIMAQTLMHGTNYINFVGYNAWVGAAGGVEAVQVTEWDEPQTVIGSWMHKNVYPDDYKRHLERGRKLITEVSALGAFTHPARGDVGCVQLVGEYLYVAEGAGGFRVYDVASIANKGIGQRIITAPFGPLGHDTHVGTRNATCVGMPASAQAIAPMRQKKDEATRKLMLETNEEQPFHDIYDFAIVTDAEEGLILVDINTLRDGDPLNNFLKRALTWNENGILKGARHLTVAGTTLYITADAGVVVLDLDKVMTPRVRAVIPFDKAHSTALQFRYLFVTDPEGLHVVDVTDPAKPRKVPGATVPLKEAYRIYVARTYAYVAAGAAGLAIIDVERPEKPFVYMMYTAEGKISDARDVIVGSTNASAYAYVADGRNGLKVISLTAPNNQPNFYGFAPDPKPELIAWWPTRWPALSLSKGLDRDRGVDETGHQMSVFGRTGSRPFNLAEQKRFYLDKDGQPWVTSDDVRMADFLSDPNRKPRPPLSSRAVEAEAIEAPSGAGAAGFRFRR